MTVLGHQPHRPLPLGLLRHRRSSFQERKSPPSPGRFSLANKSEDPATGKIRQNTYSRTSPDAPPTFSNAQGYNGSSWKTLSVASDVQFYMDTCGLVTEMADAEAIQGTSSFTAHFDSHGDNDFCG